MSKEKQIEKDELQELVITLSDCQHRYDKECIKAIVTKSPLPKENKFYAKYLMEQGYHKQSEPFSCDHEKGSEWISVEERLPDSGVHCLISCTVKRIGGTLGHYVCVGYYAERFKHLAYGVDDDCVSEYNEKNDEFYIAEGWYEVIKNWDDYGFVAINDYVTHWMPLPEAPKMKGGVE